MGAILGARKGKANLVIGIVPSSDAARLQIKLLQKGTLKIYSGFPMGC